jgi:hypothetical protein
MTCLFVAVSGGATVRWFHLEGCIALLWAKVTRSNRVGAPGKHVPSVRGLWRLDLTERMALMPNKAVNPRLTSGVGRFDP